MADNYIRFRSASSFTLQVNGNIKTWNGTIEYSNNASSWSTWDGVSVLSSGGSNNYLYLRGTGNTYITGENYYYDNYWVLTGSEIYCEYNIENLLDYATVAAGNHPTVGTMCFADLFCDCAALVQAPEILTPYNTTGSFTCMFLCCTGLKYPPSQLVMSSAHGWAAYEMMFYGCTSLLYTPTFPNLTKVDYYCFINMFQGCTSLTTLPDLSATTFMGDHSYEGMFQGCTSIKVSQAQTGAYTKQWRLPPTGTATQSASYNTRDMLSGTGGTFTGDPQLNTTYYLFESPKVTFSSDASFNIHTSENGWNGTIQYSSDGATWNTWDGNQIYSGVDHKIYLRGIGNTTVSTSQNTRIQIIRQSGYNISCSGPIDSLLDYQMLENGQVPPMDAGCFTSFFWGASMDTAPTFSNRQLTESCYQRMFGWARLTVAPELPSTQLAPHCYDYMFCRCTELITPPSILPATTLAESCYSEMFFQCTALNSLPAISATALATKCCYSMFRWCEALTSASSLQLLATELAESCYELMFQGCDVLVTPCELPATTLANRCYNGMFQSCPQLVIAPNLPATTLFDNCYYDMFSYCTSLVSPPNIAATTAASYSCYCMFKGCTSLVRVPKFNFINSSPRCWYSMFQNCTSLLYPANIQIDYVQGYACYSMYSGCSSMKLSETQTSCYTRPFRIPTTGDASMAQYALNNMFQSTGGTFTGTPSLNTTYYVYEVPALTFSSNNSFTLSVYNSTKNWDGTLYCSQDEVNWIAWDGTTTLSSNSDYKLFLRGVGNTVITGSNTNIKRFVFNGGAISCVGNIESLLDYSTVEQGGHPSMGEYAFKALFYRSTLISPPELPSTTLSSACYSQLFSQSASLTTAPALPATTITNNCYGGMFSECTSLTTPPELPATTLASGCYYDMFYECASLTVAPELPATTLTTTCYHQMFKMCVSLITPPALPATTLADDCYTSMFEWCKNLTSVPVLPATSLTYSCYQKMFKNCTSLTALPLLPSTTLAQSCYIGMFEGCTNIKLYSTSSTLGKPYRIPSEGTGTDYAGAMADMFKNTGGDNIGTPTINTTYYYPAMVTVSAQYGDETLFSYNQMSDQLYDRIIYDDEIQSADNWMGTKIFNTVNTIMSSHFIVGLKALLCSNKVMDKNITVTSTWAS